MKIELRLFSGTGNSSKVLNTCKDVFVANDHRVSMASIIDELGIDDDSDLIGFCFPVYAFGIPRICRKYLSNLPRFTHPIRTFILITGGDADEAGFSIRESTLILYKKGLEVTYSKIVPMPNNWTVATDPPPRDEARPIIESGVAKAREIAWEILCDVVHHHEFNYPSRLSRVGFYRDYYLFKWLGVNNLWRDFRTDGTCDSCGLCERICPTRSIRMTNGKPSWLKTCEQCMRCVNYCPKQAIYQKGKGSIKGKNTYYEPTFNPLKKRVTKT